MTCTYLAIRNRLLEIPNTPYQELKSKCELPMSHSLSLELRMFDAIKGIIVGAGIGGLAGLGVCIWLIPENLFFPGDTMLFGAVLCGVLGHIYGDSFFEWLGDNWHHWI